MKRRLPATAITEASRERIEEWLESPEIDAGFLTKDLKFSFGFTNQGPPGVEGILNLRADGGETSWFGGPAIAPLPEWPRTVDGEPLAHIATIYLPELPQWMGSTDYPEDNWPEPAARLPESGYLEVFQHLQTYGNPEDAGTGGWLVRYVPWEVTEENWMDTPALVYPPEDLDLPGDFCQSAWPLPTFSIPRATDFIGARTSKFDAATRAEEELYARWMAQHAGTETIKDDGWLVPFTHLYGHSDSGTYYALEMLNEAIPLEEENDRYVLLLSVESWTQFEGWFGDVGNLEVWMRESDLAARRFDKAWTMIRTD